MKVASEFRQLQKSRAAIAHGGKVLELTTTLLDPAMDVQACLHSTDNVIMQVDLNSLTKKMAWWVWLFQDTAGLEVVQGIIVFRPSRSREILGFVLVARSKTLK